MEREQFLQRLRSALGRERRQDDAAAAVPPAPLPDRIDHPGDDPDRWPDRFGAELTAAGGTWEYALPVSVDDRAAAPARRRVAAAGLRASAYASEHQITRAVMWDPDTAGQLAGQLLQSARDQLEAAGCRTTCWDPQADAASLRSAAAGAGLGIVVADRALAASGSVFLRSGPGRGRSVSLLPEHLLVFVPAQVIRPTLAEAMAELDAGLAPGHCGSGMLPQNMVWITGPSKSADIELELVTGVHGPRTVHAIVVPRL